MNAPDPLATMIGVLTEHRHKAPRVQAKLLAEALNPTPAAAVPVQIGREAQAWDATKDRIGRLIDEGIATTRNRTHAAMRALGLNPTEVRALVIEHDSIRVYRYDPTVSDKTGHRPSIPQTMPILEESA